MRKLIALGILLFPWKIRRLIYRNYFKYEIDDSSYIGFSWLFPESLILCNEAKIGHLNYCKNIRLLKVGEYSILGSLNWITGFPIIPNYTGHFSKEESRTPELVLDEHSAITSRHFIDCTNSVRIGSFSTVAGIRSQLLTHSIDIYESKQVSNRIEIGRYCFIGSSSIILKGTKIPDYSVLGSMSLANKQYPEKFALYAGVPAKKIKNLPESTKYFSRKTGFIK